LHRQSVKDAETIRDLDQRIKAMEVSQISTKSSLEILNARLDKEVRSLQTKLGLEAKKVTTLERSHEKFRNKFLAQDKKLAELEERMRALLPRLVPVIEELSVESMISRPLNDELEEGSSAATKMSKDIAPSSPETQASESESSYELHRAETLEEKE